VIDHFEADDGVNYKNKSPSHMGLCDYRTAERHILLLKLLNKLLRVDQRPTGNNIGRILTFEIADQKHASEEDLEGSCVI
jgi:aminoglycoside phosphotransferase family enzyme